MRLPRSFFLSFADLTALHEYRRQPFQDELLVGRLRSFARTGPETVPVRFTYVWRDCPPRWFIEIRRRRWSRLAKVPSMPKMIAFFMFTFSQSFLAHRGALAATLHSAASGLKGGGSGMCAQASTYLSRMAKNFSPSQ